MSLCSGEKTCHFHGKRTNPFRSNIVSYQPASSNGLKICATAHVKPSQSVPCLSFIIMYIYRPSLHQKPPAPFLSWRFSYRIYNGLAVSKLLASLADCISDPDPDPVSELGGPNLAVVPLPLGPRRPAGTPSLDMIPSVSSEESFRTRRLINSIASRSVSPLSSIAARKRASSLQSSQSCSRIAREKSRTDCSDAAEISSKVCNTNR